MQTNERVLRLQGASNFRDLGGYHGHGGRPLRWRRLFRSDHLGGLTEPDRAALVAMGVKRTFVFRGTQERAAEPYALPGVAQHALSIEPTVVQRMAEIACAGAALTAERAAELMCELYQRLAVDQAHRFAEWFAHLLDDDAPLVFHCTAGKDRTGVAAALLLIALGVPRDVVERDYLLSNDCYRPHTPRGELPGDVLNVLWTVRASFLHTALAAIDGAAGGMQAYLTQRLRLSPAARQRLAELYLEPAPR